jgi:hypothetical protein
VSGHRHDHAHGQLVFQIPAPSLNLSFSSPGRQLIRTRPTSKKASVVLAAMLSAWDSDGCDDSVVWTDMVFPLDASLAVRVVFLHLDFH